MLGYIKRTKPTLFQDTHNTATHLSHTLLFWKIIILLPISLNISILLHLSYKIFLLRQHLLHNTTTHLSHTLLLWNIIILLPISLNISILLHLFYKISLLRQHLLHNTTTHLSHTLLLWNIIILLPISLKIYFFIFFTKSLFLDNTYYTTLLPISPILYYYEISSSCCPYL